MAKITLTVVSQEKELLTAQVDSVTIPASQGEITVLPQHIPLFSPLQPGVITYREDQSENHIVVSKGFVDIGPDNQITIIVDTAVHARDISLDKAEAAIKAAHETMANSQDRQELLMAEASLRQALLEMKVAHATRKNRI